MTLLMFLTSLLTISQAIDCSSYGGIEGPSNVCCSDGCSKCAVTADVCYELAPTPPPTTAPTPPPTTDPTSACRLYSGISGSKADVCCDENCSQCGGPGCGDANLGGDACCTSNIIDAGLECSSTQNAPCLLDERRRLAAGGGSGSGTVPERQEKCCAKYILQEGNMCGQSMAPCVYEPPAPTSQPLAPTSLPTEMPSYSLEDVKKVAAAVLAVLVVGGCCVCICVGCMIWMFCYGQSDTGADTTEATQLARRSDLPRGWRSKTDPKTGKTYYEVIATGVTQWEKPGYDV